MIPPIFNNFYNLSVQLLIPVTVLFLSSKIPFPTSILLFVKIGLVVSLTKLMNTFFSPLSTFSSNFFSYSVKLNFSMPLIEDKLLNSPTSILLFVNNFYLYLSPLLMDFFFILLITFNNDYFSCLFKLNSLLYFLMLSSSTSLPASTGIIHYYPSPLFTS